jgi:hypothetical protein
MRRTNPKDYTDEDIFRILSADCEIQNYRISQPGNEETALLYFYDVKEGRYWVHLIEDEGLNEACVQYLKKQNIPVFSDINNLLKQAPNQN